MRHKATHLLKKNEEWMLPSWTFSFVSWWTESFHSEFLSIWCGQYCTSTIDIPPVSRWLRLVICKPRSRYGIWYLWKNRIETTERAEVEKSWQSLIRYFQFDSGIGKKFEITRANQADSLSSFSKSTIWVRNDVSGWNMLEYDGIFSSSQKERF